MTEYMTEEEQIALLKKWIKEYSTVILVGLTLSAVTITGWRWWNARQQRILSEASSAYDEMLAARAQDDKTTTSVKAEKLFSDYDNTVYAQMAAMMMARDAVEDANYVEAEKKLQWIIDHSKFASFRQIARIRMARVLLNEDKAQESLNLLSTVDDKTFSGVIDEVKGDAYVALKNNPEARKAYAAAISETPDADISRPVLRMKYDNLATFSA